MMTLNAGADPRICYKIGFKVSVSGDNKPINCET